MLSVKYLTQVDHTSCAEAVEDPTSEFLWEGMSALPQSSASIHSSPCPFPPSFCLETIITGPSYAVTSSPQLCPWPCWTWSGHWKFTLLFHNPLLSPSIGSKGLNLGWPIGKKDPLSPWLGKRICKKRRGISIQGQYIYTIWNSQPKHFQVFGS